MTALGQSGHSETAVLRQLLLPTNQELELGFWDVFGALLVNVSSSRIPAEKIFFLIQPTAMQSESD